MSDLKTGDFVKHQGDANVHQVLHVKGDEIELVPVRGRGLWVGSAALSVKVAKVKGRWIESE